MLEPKGLVTVCTVGAGLMDLTVCTGGAGLTDLPRIVPNIVGGCCTAVLIPKEPPNPAIAQFCGDSGDVGGVLCIVSGGTVTGRTAVGRVAGPTWYVWTGNALAR